MFNKTFNFIIKQLVFIKNNKMNLTNEQKAKIYDQMIFRYQRLSEQIRQIKSKNFEVSDKDQQTINELERQMKIIYNDSQKLFVN